MDNRLKRRHGGRRVPSRILAADLPELAWVLTAIVRGGAKSQVHRPKNVAYVRLISPVGPDVSLRAKDWAKILPLIEDGTFSPLQVPVEAGFQVSDPIVRFSTPNLREQDPLYKRILFYLSETFPEETDGN